RGAREVFELSDVRRQRSQYLEYLGRKDRYESAAVRKHVVGTAGSVWGTWESAQHVRRLLLLQENADSPRHLVYEIPRGSLLKSRSIESREHVFVQFRRRAHLLDRCVCTRCDGRQGHVQDGGRRRRTQMERACGERAVLHALAQ